MNKQPNNINNFDDIEIFKITHPNNNKCDTFYLHLYIKKIYEKIIKQSMPPIIKSNLYDVLNNTIEPKNIIFLLKPDETNVKTFFTIENFKFFYYNL
jgi:hypothetical protein